MHETESIVRLLSIPSTLIVCMYVYMYVGETTVKFGQGGLGSGKGGRCSHMALLVARHLSGLDNWCLVSAGTDGQDGPCDSAGAFADGHTWLRGRNAGRSVLPVLALGGGLLAFGERYPPPIGLGVLWDAFEYE